MSLFWRICYTSLFYLLTPLFLFRLFLRGRKAPAYRKRISERFGYCPWKEDASPIWVHAVSVGEVIAISPLVEQLLTTQPVIMTTTTPTGSDRARATFGYRVLHAYMPYDLPGAVSRFIRCSKPAMLVTMETEIWPNLFRHCYNTHIPVVIVNARLSQRSAARYGRFHALTRDTLNCCRLIAAQGNKDAQRFIDLGAPPDRVVVTGNLKYECPIPVNLAQRVANLKTLWQLEHGSQRPAWLAASTHEGEESLIIEAFRKIRLSIPDLMLVFAPRHPERFEKVTSLCVKSGYRVALRSDATLTTGELLDCDVFVGNTMGELLDLYAASDLCFVGGSLIPRGGHNIIESAAVGCPILFGPHMFNFLDIAETMLARKAAIQVSNSEELAATVVNLLNNRQHLKQMATTAFHCYKDNQGALNATRTLIDDLLNEKTIDS